jgi:hypothetical protein
MGLKENDKEILIFQPSAYFENQDNFHLPYIFDYSKQFL